MNAINNFTRFVDDLAGHWTDPALEILKDMSIRPVSVDMELESWQTLKQVLKAELRWQRAFQPLTPVSLRTLMETVLRKAIPQVAQQFGRRLDSVEIEERIRGLVWGRRIPAGERGLHIQLVGQPGLRAAFKPSKRTDYFPRLSVSAVGS